MIVEDVQDAESNLAKLIERAVAGEEVIVTDGGRRRGRLVQQTVARSGLAAPG
jgi:prevent-host-death family protein